MRRHGSSGAGWAAPAFCPRCSIVARIGLVGRLARAPSPRWRPRARSCLPLCSCALPHVLVSPQGSGSRQSSYTSLQFLPDIDLPAHGMRPTTAGPLLHRHTHIHSLLYALTAHQPVCASQGPMGPTPMGCGDGPQVARTRPLRAEACHAWSERRRQRSSRGWRPRWGLALWISIPILVNP